MNTYLFDWESDFFSVSKSGYFYEIEIKISKSDFLKDFEKPKHFLFKNRNAGIVLEKFPEERKDWFTDMKFHNVNNWFDDEQRRTVYAPYCKVTWHDSEKFRIPNRFYYAAPAGVLKKEDMPEYAGLILVHETNTTISKEAPFLHKRNLFDELRSSMLDKFYWLSEQQRQVIVNNSWRHKENESTSL